MDMEAEAVGKAADPGECPNHGFLRMSTSANMEIAKESFMYVPCVWCCTGMCCFWVPMIMFFAAANVLTTCENDLSIFLKVYGLVNIILTPLALTLAVGAAHVGSRGCFKLASKMPALGSVFGFAMTIAGWVLWGQSTDVACYSPDVAHEHADINPRTLILVYNIMGTVGWGCSIPALCRSRSDNVTPS
mmetsp:Transcript_101571/g.270100  ORF Transcript_101571/g.270100 Transcript_101571/m.270100 type:complete len:189 (-) Transcript_101571:93-659(-)